MALRKLFRKVSNVLSVVITAELGVQLADELRRIQNLNVREVVLEKAVHGCVEILAVAPELRSAECLSALLAPLTLGPDDYPYGYFTTRGRIILAGMTSLLELDDSILAASHVGGLFLAADRAMKSGADEVALSAVFLAADLMLRQARTRSVQNVGSLHGFSQYPGGEMLRKIVGEKLDALADCYAPAAEIVINRCLREAGDIREANQVRFERVLRATRLFIRHTLPVSEDHKRLFIYARNVVPTHFTESSGAARVVDMRGRPFLRRTVAEDSVFMLQREVDSFFARRGISMPSDTPDSGGPQPA